MSIDIDGIVAAVSSHAQELGVFDSVNGHDPTRNVGTTGLTAVVFMRNLVPYARGSGLAAASALLVLYVRMFTPVMTEPLDLIDPAMVKATDLLLNAYAGDFQLGGITSLRCIDVFGQAGVPMSAESGYLPTPDQTFRVVTITLPLILDDVWTEAP